jgi:hypothetical protein
MQTKDYVIIGGIALIVYLLWKKSAQGGGAGALGGGSGGGSGAGAGGCGCAGTPPAQGCASPSPGFGNWTQGGGPYPPEAFTGYNPPGGYAWDEPGFHFSLDFAI